MLSRHNSCRKIHCNKILQLTQGHQWSSKPILSSNLSFRKLEDIFIYFFSGDCFTQSTTNYFNKVPVLSRDRESPFRKNVINNDPNKSSEM